MTTKLILYNLALQNLGERKISGLTENREPRRVLDDYYDTVTAYCLAQGMWDFALRASGALTRAAGDYGFAYAFALPADIIFLFAIADNTGFNPQIDRDFFRQGASFFSNATALYSRYTSNDATSGGMNLANWPANFTTYVAAALSRAACMRITGNAKLADQMQEQEDRFYLTSFSTDSIALVQGQLPFNAVALNDLSNDAVRTGHALLPFAAYHGAMARLRPQQQQAQG